MLIQYGKRYRTEPFSLGISDLQCGIDVVLFKFGRKTCHVSERKVKQFIGLFKTFPNVIS